jgi:hypothetical protein
MQNDVNQMFTVTVQGTSARISEQFILTQTWNDMHRERCFNHHLCEAYVAVRTWPQADPLEAAAEGEKNSQNLKKEKKVSASLCLWLV